MSNVKNASLRYKKTLDYFILHASKDDRILDLGTPNELSKELKQSGYNVINTSGQDFDTEFMSVINEYEVDCYTSFEVFEHLLAPFNLLRSIKKGKKMICSVPLNVWFSNAYWNDNNEWARHYHEFEPKQFDWLMEKAGWKIIHKEEWKSPDKLRFGIRPFLRFIFPSYYFVYAEKVI